MARQAVSEGEGEGTEMRSDPPTATVRTIRVCWGEEVIQPIQYNGVRVGPLEVVVDVLPGQDPVKVYEETWAWLDKLGKDQFSRKMDGFLGRLAEASNRARKAQR